MPDQDTILLQTKLHRPRLPERLLARPQLFERLNQGLHHPLILVCGPPGFGKTTLIGSWVEQIASIRENTAPTLPSAWLSLDARDSDLNLFMRYFIAAVRTVVEDACEESLRLVRAPQQPPREVLYATLSNDLDRLPEEIVLVLDDYHTIRNTEVHDLLGELVSHWPRPLHLVLVSRISPPIPLNSIRASGMLSELRTRDLRFRPEETAAYMSQAGEATFAQEALPLLQDRFEGWPAGLHLAVLSLKSQASQEALLSAVSSENPNITGYLIDEVLGHQSPAIRTFLVRTSILDRVCAPLSEAILGPVDSPWSARACLDSIERSELFISSVDDQRHWYRYHHLFQEMLQQRLAAEMSPDQVAELHRRASIWFQEQGLVEEALQHTLAAGDLDLAAHQMAAALREVINREDRPTLERWLRSLPEEMIERRPEMLMVRAWALEFSWQLNRQAHVLRQIEGLLDSDAGRLLPAEDLQILRGQILPLRAQAAYFANQPTQAIGLCQEALALLPSSWTFCRGGTMMYLGMALQASGESRAADRLLLDEYQSCSDKSGTYAALVLRALCFNHLNAGRLEQARRVARALLEGATQSGVAIMLSWAHWFLGIVCFERNDLETAAHHFQKIADDRYSAQITAYRDAVAGLALIHQIHGEATQARQLVESVSQFDLEVRGKEADRTHSLRARLRLLEGDLEEARRWAEAFSGPPPDQPFLWLEEPQVTRARVLAASGGEADLRLALELLDSLEDIADRTHNTRYKIHLLALRAVALDTHGQIHEAQKALSQAVTMARPGGFLRVYLELGERMLQMLGRLAAQGDSTETIGGILGAFEGGEHRPMASKGLAQPNRQASPAASPLPEPLTPRELEVLSLLRGPQSVKEIALQLHISPATAKRHIANVYGKLDVKQRWQAVARAEELHILSPR